MASDRVALNLQGTVSLDDYAKAVSGLCALIGALTREVAGDAKIDWIIEDLRAGSAAATIVGLSDEPDDVERVVNAYAQVGAAVKTGSPIPFSESVKKETLKITGILNGQVTSITFEAQDEPYEITSQVMYTPDERHLATAFGAVEGVVHNLYGKPGLRFTLFDFNFDRAVSCYLSVEPGERDRQIEMLRPIWEKPAVVYGMVTRDSLTDRPTEVREITQVLPLVTGDYRRARGVLSHRKDKTAAEESIRKARDA